MFSTTKLLNATKIRNICLSAEGQQEITAFVKTLSTQGVTQMFINFSKVEGLIKKMISDHILADSPMLLKEFSTETIESNFTKFLTPKVINFISAVQTLDQMPEFHGMPMLKNFLHKYLANAMRPLTLFFWMSEFAISYKEMFERFISKHFLFERNAFQQVAEYKALIEKAFPLGVEAEVKALSWVSSNSDSYAKIDFAEIFSAIPFDRYYSELFEKDGDSASMINVSPEMQRFSFISKEEIKHLSNEAFKPMILDIVFKNIQSRKVEDINAEITKLFAEKPILVYQQYSRAIFTVKASEMSRLQKEFMKYFDENGIPYTLESRQQQLDPLMFADTPEGSYPS